MFLDRTNSLSWFTMEDKVQKHFKENKRINDGVAMGAALGDFLNGADEDDIADMLQFMTQMEHRTIQQEYFGLVLKSIQAFAEMKDCQTDGRNEIAVRKARELYNYMEEAQMGVKMPCI